MQFSTHTRKLLLVNFTFRLIFIYYTSVAEEATTQLFIGKEHSNTVFDLLLRKEIILQVFKVNSRFGLFIKIRSVHTWTFLFPLNTHNFTICHLRQTYQTKCSHVIGNVSIFTTYIGEAIKLKQNSQTIQASCGKRSFHLVSPLITYKLKKKK